MSEQRYREDQFAKLLTVVNAAEQNAGSYTEVRLQTTGHEPSASVTISARLLREFLTASKKVNQ